MSWTILELQHNASMVYNHLCSRDADNVYVDVHEHLQIDNRSRFLKWISPLGDRSREATDQVAIRTLRRVMRALEDGTLNPNQIIIQEQIPTGMFMEGDEVQGSLQGIYRHVIDPQSPLESTNEQPPNVKWIAKDTFARNICNASRFKAWMPCGNRVKENLTEEQIVCSKVTVLTQMIMHGRDQYKSICESDGYENSDKE